MDFDELLRQAWQREQAPVPGRDLTGRVRRRRQRLLLQRGMEAALTVAAVVLFGRALLGGGAGPSHWLLLPFFAVYIPVAWAFVLRAPRQRARDASERTDIYARLRLAQLRTGLRELWFARLAADVLLAYAVVANVLIRLLAERTWHEAGGLLLAAAGAWWLGSWWLVRTARRRWLREYRGVRRLVDG